MLLVSTCLLGLLTRYDAKRLEADARLLQLARQGLLIPVCPEQLGGLPTPRAPAEIVGGDGDDVLARRAHVVTADGLDVTEAYLLGAREVARLARQLRAGGAILKDHSPSCGCKYIHNGTFSGRITRGVGVTAALLRQEGIRLYDPADPGLGEQLAGLVSGNSDPQGTSKR